MGRAYLSYPPIPRGYRGGDPRLLQKPEKAEPTPPPSDPPQNLVKIQSSIGGSQWGPDSLTTYNGGRFSERPTAPIPMWWGVSGYDKYALPTSPPAQGGASCPIYPWKTCF